MPVVRHGGERVTILAPADIPIAQICGRRDQAIRRMAEAVETIARGHALAEEARQLADEATAGERFHLVDRTLDRDYQRIFTPFDKDASSAVFRRHTDASVWLHLSKFTGLEHLMDATAREDFSRDLAGEVPEVNEANLHATLEGVRGDAHLIFQRGLARAFSDLDKRFRSHDAFKLGARIVLTRVFDEWGTFSWSSPSRGAIQDVERVLAVLDGQLPQPGELFAAIDRSREGSRLGRALNLGARQGTAETRYLRIRSFKNGNAHLWFTRDDLVEKANRVLADYYGEVLPDATPRDDGAVPKSGLPAKDLSFYATPPAVVEALLRELPIEDGAEVLEPSAGEGAIASELVKRGYAVDAVEIEPSRVDRLCVIRGLRVLPGNFLQMPPRRHYAAVLMNPPFYGTHWMEHVVHAFGFLKPGGVLRTVLPATAEVGESSAHEQFRAWAAERSEYGRLRFRELPAESFAASGTRINTVILELRA